MNRTMNFLTSKAVESNNNNNNNNIYANNNNNNNIYAPNLLLQLAVWISEVMHLQFLQTALYPLHVMR